MQTARAYFDGKNIRLEDPLELQTSDKLLVTLLKEEQAEDGGFADIESASLQDISNGDFLAPEEIRHYLSLP